MPDSVRRTLPNLLTISRVVLAIGFFVIVAFGLWPSPGENVASRQFWGNIAVVVFVALLAFALVFFRFAPKES